MTHGDWERWKSELGTVKDVDVALKMPLDVLVGEAVEVARFVETYWNPAGDRPGLEVAGRGLTKGIADEILSLRGAVQEAETNYRLISLPATSTAGLIDRARFVLGEITATIEWLLDDNVAEEADLQLKNLRDAHDDDTGRAAELAQELHDYATLIREQSAEKPVASWRERIGEPDGTAGEPHTTARGLGPRLEGVGK